MSEQLITYVEIGTCLNCKFYSKNFTNNKLYIEEKRCIKYPPDTSGNFSYISHPEKITCFEWKPI